MKNDESINCNLHHCINNLDNTNAVIIIPLNVLNNNSASIKTHISQAISPEY